MIEWPRGEHKIRIFQPKCNVLLLCRHTDDGVFDDFLEIFEDFLKLFRRPEAGSYILKDYAKQPLAVRTTSGLHSFRHLASDA